MEEHITEQEIIDGILKKRLEDCRDMIKVYEKEIEKIQEECKHVNIELVNYMWAPGHIHPNTPMCSTCGKIMPQEEDLGWQSISMGLGGDQYDDYFGQSTKDELS